MWGNKPSRRAVPLGQNNISFNYFVLRKKMKTTLGNNTGMAISALIKAKPKSVVAILIPPEEEA